MRVYLSDRVAQLLDLLRKCEGAELGIVLLGKRVPDGVYVSDIYIPPQASSEGYFEVTDYSYFEKIAKRIVGWAHLGGAHRSSAFHSGIDIQTDYRHATLFEKPFVSITLSRDDYDAIIYTDAGAVKVKMYRKAWVQF